MSKFMSMLMAFFVTVLSWFGINYNPNKPTPPDTQPSESITEEVTDSGTTEPETFPDSSIVRANAYKTDVAAGCDYTASIASHENYPDTYSSELTDGIYNNSRYPSYFDAAFSGYVGAAWVPLNIDVTLNEACDKLYSFALSFLAVNTAGINIPKKVEIFISDDGESFSSIGTADIPQEIDGGVKQAVLTLTQYVSAKYVRFAISARASFVFIDEVIITGDVEEKKSETDFSAALENAYAELGAPSAPETGNTVNASLCKVSVSAGKAYEISKGASLRFPDDGVKLTDAVCNSSYESGAYTGLLSAAGQSVTVDLTEEITDIAGVEIYAYSRIASGIYLPSAVKFTAVHSDGSEETIGVCYASEKTDNGVYVFSLELLKTVSAEKIRAEFADTYCTDIYLIDEINVFAYRNQADVSEPCYPSFEISLEDNGAWDSAAADYNENQNLLQGLTPHIIAGSSMTEAENSRNTSFSSGLMNDTVHAVSTNIYCGSYQIFYSGRSRQIIYDLQHVSALGSFSFEFTNQPGWAVYAPSAVSVYISENGSSWYTAGTAEIDTGSTAVVTGVLELAKEVSARYICVEFDVKIFAGCSEIEVFGTKNIAAAQSPESAGLEKKSLFVNHRAAPSEDVLNSAADTCLLYHSTEFGYTPEQLVPYVGYVSQDGEITDTMFDSFLFLMSGAFPSGKLSYSDGKLTDWQWCIDDLFADGENILALEEAAGTVKKALGLPEDYVYPFTVALYYTNPSRSDFGDVDGDGINEDFTQTADRIKAVKAYSDMFEKRLGEYSFKNITFSGYYWMNESMGSVSVDGAVARAFSEYVHERNYDFFWIPYNRAGGYTEWASFGLDLAVMQPNYVFDKSAPYSRLTDCAMLTKLYGMGIEMEVSTSCLTTDEYYKRYMKYLSDGVKYGYMDDAVVMYYQELLIYYRAAKSSEAMERLLYDNTYSFIKGTLDIYPDALDDSFYNVGKNTVLSASLLLPSSGWQEVTVTSKPASGVLTMNKDGSFRYYPPKDFCGTVEFTYTYSTSFESSPECRAVISVVQ